MYLIVYCNGGILVYVLILSHYRFHTIILVIEVLPTYDYSYFRTASTIYVFR